MARLTGFADVKRALGDRVGMPMESRVLSSSPCFGGGTSRQVVGTGMTWLRICGSDESATGRLGHVKYGGQASQLVPGMTFAYNWQYSTCFYRYPLPQLMLHPYALHSTGNLSNTSAHHPIKFVLEPHQSGSSFTALSRF